jgi:hypothetical protein
MAPTECVFQVKQIEKLALIARLRSHHGKPPSLAAFQPTESLFAENHEPFFNTIDPERTSARISCYSSESRFSPRLR